MPGAVGIPMLRLCAGDVSEAGWCRRLRLSEHRFPIVEVLAAFRALKERLFRAIRPTFFEDGDVGIDTFPEGKQVLIGPGPISPRLFLLLENF